MPGNSSCRGGRAGDGEARGRTWVGTEQKWDGSQNAAGAVGLSNSPSGAQPTPAERAPPRIHNNSQPPSPPLPAERRAAGSCGRTTSQTRLAGTAGCTSAGQRGDAPGGGRAGREHSLQQPRARQALSTAPRAREAASMARRQAVARGSRLQPAVEARPRGPEVGDPCRGGGSRPDTFLALQGRREAGAAPLQEAARWMRRSQHVPAHQLRTMHRKAALLHHVFSPSGLPTPADAGRCCTRTPAAAAAAWQARTSGRPTAAPWGCCARTCRHADARAAHADDAPRPPAADELSYAFQIVAGQQAGRRLDGKGPGPACAALNERMRGSGSGGGGGAIVAALHAAGSARIQAGRSADILDAVSCSPAGRPPRRRSTALA